MSVMGDVIHPLMAAGFWNAGTPLSTGEQFEPKMRSDPWVVFLYRICIVVASEVGCRDLCSKHMRAYLLDAPCEQVFAHGVCVQKISINSTVKPLICMQGY